MASGHIQRFVGIGEGRQFTRLGRLDQPVLAGRLRFQLQVWKAGRWFMCLPMTAMRRDRPSTCDTMGV
jgi:hypothetical protein